MKKYSSTTKANSRHSTIKGWQRGALFTGVLLCLGWWFPQLLSGLSAVVLAPVHAVGTWYRESESALPVYLRSRAELLVRIEELESTLSNRMGTNLSVDRLLAENMQLRAAAEMGVSKERVIAKVIAQPTTLSYDLLQIDQGSAAGVVVGAPVFLGVDTIIGVVVHVAPTYSFVELVTTPGFLGTAYIVGPNLFAPIEGVGGGVARVKVPQGVPLREGNLILFPSVTSGVYGEIVSIENVPTQPEQYGYVTPPVSLQSILYVSVGTNVLVPLEEFEIDDNVRRVVREYFRLDAMPVLSDITSSATTTNLASTTPGETELIE